MDSDKKDDEHKRPAEKYKVYFELAAQKEIGALDDRVKASFVEPIRRMKQRPSQDATILKNVNASIPLYKKRVGDYRIFFSVDSKNKQVVILAIRKRDSDTYVPTELKEIVNRYKGPHEKQPSKPSSKKNGK